MSKIASVIGKPLCTYGITTRQERLSFARICIEISAKNELLTDILLKGPNGERLEQNVEYEWMPAKCTYCKFFGHKTENCKSKPIPIWRSIAAESNKQEESTQPNPQPN
eukprot:TRINITY_DN1208_c1_g1_i1.p1 TRINITY_DN1208_c1_g1~~TRINITY_DN1208_c1_g1_i1.p1  ORF type:complete len:109 (+),score=10.27 TRINITY_DN1208_c1_g1_i1:913-1239(+)